LVTLCFVTSKPLPARGSSMDSCSCVAPDGSCSASVSCQGGCIKFCGNNNNCSASCSGGHAALGEEVTFDLQNAGYPELVAELSRRTGKELVFSPTKPDMIFNAGYKRAILWDALKALADQGTLYVGGNDFEKLKRLRKILLSGERITFCVTNTPVNTFVSDMSGLTGMTFRITSGRPMTTANVQLQNVTLSEIVAAVSEQTHTKIVYGEAAEAQ
jgi:hypothetical protein